MQPCKRVGIDVTWKCQWQCRQCFYLHNPSFHRPIDVPLNQIKSKIDEAHAGGLDHVVMVGYGEPSLCANTPAILDYAHSKGMSTSMISNGATGLERFKGYFAQGMDHIHLSSHGIGDTLDTIVGTPGAYAKQHELKEWLRSESIPFRTNASLQRLNYTELVRLAEHEFSMGVSHFVFLGFLPHYERADDILDVAVHPGKLRPHIEAAADVLMASNTLFTIRYQPFCHLASRYWKYVVNARYVLFDNFEWNYSLQAHDAAALWKDSMSIGDSVAIHGEPCRSCLARRHCGGWNKTYAAAFGGAGLRAIKEVPEEYAACWDRDGGLHDLNPATSRPSNLQ